MPFVITTMNAGGPVSVERDTATEALEKVLDLEAVSFQSTEVIDDHGRRLTRDELTSRSTLQRDG